MNYLHGDLRRHLLVNLRLWSNLCVNNLLSRSCCCNHLLIYTTIRLLRHWCSNLLSINRLPLRVLTLIIWWMGGRWSLLILRNYDVHLSLIFFLQFFSWVSSFSCCCPYIVKGVYAFQIIIAITTYTAYNDDHRYDDDDSVEGLWSFTLLLVSCSIKIISRTSSRVRFITLTFKIHTIRSEKGSILSVTANITAIVTPIVPRASAQILTHKC